ncbi:MAG: hypothetical protein CMF62_03460 [Magnetococcales bacterium]|nr:hypothetical protein [Magnetococcales bacterium]
MNAIYYQLICKITYDNNYEDFKLCVLGDQNQSIFKFNKADERFIVYGDRLFDFEFDNFKKLNLSISFRVTNQIVDFLNNCLLGYERMKAQKEGDTVRYIICNTYGTKKNPPRATFEEIEYYLNKGYEYEDIFVLCPSLKSQRTGVRILSNWLTEKDIPVYVPVSDNENLDQDILNNKIVFSTFHQVKGLERKVVLIFNFDESYTKFYNQSCDPNVCPNEIYVAVTRASECLTVFHDNRQNYLPFCNVNILEDYCDVIEYNPLKISKFKMQNKMKLNVSTLTNHLPFEVVEHCTTFFKTKIVKEKKEKINIRGKVKNDEGNYETVQDITAVAIPAYFEYMKTGLLSIYDPKVEEETLLYDENEEYAFSDIDDESEEEIEESKELSIPRLLFLSNLYISKQTGYRFKMNQIESYNWLRRDQLEKCTLRLDKLIGEDVEFNIDFEIDEKEELQNKKLSGVFDIIDGNKIWMLRCLDKIENVHLIQLALNAYVYHSLYPLEDPSFFIVNILTKEVISIYYDIDNLRKMVRYLIIQKYNTEQALSDNKFIESIEKIKHIYYE